MNKINAKIVADSISPQGNRITSYILTYPRFIHAELMTHRMFSRNSASSRAIPFAKMVKMVQEDPFIPIAWQKDHKGMQGNEYFINAEEIEVQNRKWLQGRDAAVVITKRLNENNVTKQLCNRLLEPFMWHTVLVTATEWENFFALRTPCYEVSGYPANRSKEALEPSVSTFKSKKDAIKWLPELEQLDFYDWQNNNHSQAEIHIQALAEAMWDQKQESIPKQLKAGEWHIPFGDRLDDDYILQILAKEEEIKHLDSAYDIYQYYAVRIAIARCARLSYMTFDGEIDYEKDIKLFDHLYKSKHMSPFEHVARCMTELEYYSFVKGKYPTIEDEYGIVNYERYPLLKKAMFEEEVIGENPNNGNKYGWCNNFRGFIPYRYLIENQNDI